LSGPLLKGFKKGSEKGYEEVSGKGCPATSFQQRAYFAGKDIDHPHFQTVKKIWSLDKGRNGRHEDVTFVDDLEVAGLGL
jgi:hypothetical protein